MGIPVLVMGPSGSGKTYSLKNFEASDVSIFSVEKSRLPFQKKLPVMAHATYTEIEKVLSGTLSKKSYVIDDSQYLLVNESFDRAKENGFSKWTDIALHFRDLIHFINHNLPDDVIVYFLHHSEEVDGKTKAKTIGKLLDNQLTVEGCFDVVLLAQMFDGQHCFITQSDGYTTAKSPEGMFNARIPNDLKAVDVAIRSYYGL